MRRTIILMMSLVLALSLGASGAWGDVINCPDVTRILQQSGAGAIGPWTDVVGPLETFNTFNATFDTDTHVLTMFTNWGPGNKTVSLFKTADLFLNYDPNTETALAAVQLFGPVGATVNTVFYDPTIQTSRDLFFPSGVLGFGGFYTTNINADGPPSFEIPVSATGGTSTGNATVTWTSLGAVEPFFSFAIDLDEIDGLNPGDFNFLWGTATCGNDVIACTIPLPPSLLLLGSGLLGLLGWRRLKKS